MPIKPKTEECINESLTAEEHAEIGQAIKNGYTSGRCDNETDMVAWELCYNKFR